MALAAPADGSPLLRICMLAACPFPANHGTPGSIREIAEALVVLGHEVHVVTYHYGDDIPMEGVRIHRITPLTREKVVAVGPTIRRPLYDAQMISTTVQVARRFRVDLLHAHGYEAALIAAACRVVTGLPVIYSAHNTMADELPSYGFIRPQWLAAGIARVLDAIVPRLADRCVPHSSNVARFLERQGLRGRIDQIVNFGIDVDWMSGGNASGMREQYALGPGPIVLYAGVLDRFQRVDLLLEATALVANRCPSITLLIVSSVPQPHYVAELRRQATQLGIAERVVIAESQPLERVRDLLPVADVAVVPRPAAAGFPIKLLNYMAARRPTVLFSSSASAGIVHRQNAMLASPDTPDALAREIVTLLENAELRSDIGRSGFEFVRLHHDRAAIARHLCQCYERVLGRLQPDESECHAF